MKPLHAVWFAAFVLFPNALPAADTIRVATFNTELQRKGPGLLLRDIQAGKDEQVAAVVKVIARVNPDVIALQGIDWDYDRHALNALADQLGDAGANYPHRFALQPNSGLATGLDMDGDGRRGGPGDTQGFGYFTGQGGIAVLSRLPITGAQDLSALLWREVPKANLPVGAVGAPFPSQEVQKIQRLSNTGHWILTLQLPGSETLSLLTFHATPPAFDGPERRNVLRNADEIRLWRQVLDGAFGPFPSQRYVIAGDANLDPVDGDGDRSAILELLSDPRISDPSPSSDGGHAASDQGHGGPGALDTVDWPAPGRLRVDYVLPSADLTVTGSGVYWPAPGTPGHEQAVRASRHRLVWVDLRVD